MWLMMKKRFWLGKFEVLFICCDWQLLRAFPYYDCLSKKAWIVNPRAELSNLQWLDNDMELDCKINEEA